MDLLPSPHTLAKLKAYPELLLELLTQKEDGQLLYFYGHNKQVDNPTDIFVGVGALHFISQLISRTCAWTGKNLNTDEWAGKFQFVTGVSINLFKDIPHSAFPVDHPFRSTSGLRFLQEYQETTALRTRLEKPTPVYFAQYAQVHHQVYLGSKKPHGKIPKVASLKRHYTEETKIENFLTHFMPGYRAAYDVYGNFWISVQTLRGLLTGEFCINTRWNDSTITESLTIKQMAEHNQKMLQLWEEQGIQVRFTPMKDDPKILPWTEGEASYIIQIMLRMIQ